MLVDITESALADAPPTTVWALVTDFRRHPDFAGPKSITKAVEFDGPVAPVAASWGTSDSGCGASSRLPTFWQWIRNESCAGCPILSMKERNRGEGGRVLWRYGLRPESGGTRLEHQMQVVEPSSGGNRLKFFYAAPAAGQAAHRRS